MRNFHPSTRCIVRFDPAPRCIAALIAANFLLVHDSNFCSRKDAEGEALEGCAFFGTLRSAAEYQSCSHGNIAIIATKNCRQHE